MIKPVSLVEEVKYRGYEKVNGIIIPSQELIDLGAFLKENTGFNITPKNLKLSKILTNSRNFIDSVLTLQKVPFYKEVKIGPIKFEVEGDIHPYGLPIKKVSAEEPFYGCLREIVTLKDGLPISLAYKFIELSKKTTELSSLAYTHELAHSQLNHINGIVKNYQNIELVSIFLELVQASSTNEHLLHTHDNERLFELSGIIDELSKYKDTTNEEIQNILIEGSSYCESTIKAYSLFFRYYYGTISEKKLIMSYIQKLFNQEICLEDILATLDITFESSIDKKGIEKYLKR